MSVRKRTWTTVNGQEKQAWVVDYSDQSGKRRLKTFARKKEADAFESRADVEISQGVHTPERTSVTVAQAAALWLKSCAANGLERATIASYGQHIDFHIVPFIGSIRLSQLSAPLVRQFADRLHEENRSPAMVKRALTSLGTLVGDAQERGLVARNVVRDLRSSRKRGKERQAASRQRGKLKIGVDIPSPIEIRRLLASLEGRWRPILLTAIFTGLRSSELRGLRWVDVDLDSGEIHVRQRADCYLKIGPPKSASGERTIPLPPMVADTIREYREMSKHRDGFVFPTGRGNIENHSNIVKRGLIPAMVKAGIINPDGTAKYSGLHALRHFYASWCINRRADGGLELPLKLVQERMGHSTIAMTADRYAHLFPRTDDGLELAAAEKSLIGVKATHTQHEVKNIN